MSHYRLETLADGFVFLEGPRWQVDRLWVSDVFGNAVYTVSESGKRSFIAAFPQGASGISILPDGRVVVVSMRDRKLMEIGADGALSVYADLSGHFEHFANDTVTDRDGNIYVGNPGYDIFNHAEPKGADMLRVTPGREIHVAARDLAFPNGAAITPDGRTLIVAETFVGRLSAFDRAPDGSLSNRRVWAELGARTPDGICLDESGAVWAASFATGEFVRVREGGQVQDVIACPGKRAVACNLGGADGRTLFALTYAGTLEDIPTGKAAGQVEVCRVAVAGAGSP